MAQNFACFIFAAHRKRKLGKTARLKIKYTCTLYSTTSADSISEYANP